MSAATAASAVSSADHAAATKPTTTASTLDATLLQQAEDGKQQGNAFYAQGLWDQAVAAYTTGIVAVDRMVPIPALLKATLLSNRAMCRLKQPPPPQRGLDDDLKACIDDCTLALNVLQNQESSSTDASSTSTSTSALRGKLLFRRAKGRNLLHNATSSNATASSNSDSSLLQEAAKDVLELLNFDPNNKEAQQLLLELRTQHKKAGTASQSTPLGKSLDALQQHKNNPNEGLHHLKVVLGLLDHDPSHTSMELGRYGGVSLLCTVIQACLEREEKSGGDTATAAATKGAVLAAQCLSASAAHPAFVRAHLNEPEFQMQLRDLVALASTTNSSDAVVSLLAVYDRLILHLDRDDPQLDVPVTGITGIVAANLVDACRAALTPLSQRCDDRTIVRAVLDVLGVWTAGKDRESAIRAALGTTSDPLLPPPVSPAEYRAMTPQETAVHKKREYEQRTRDEAWAYERGLYLVAPSPSTGSASTPTTISSGLQLLLGVATKCQDHILRREVTVTVGRILAGIESDDKIKEVLAPLLGDSATSKNSSKSGVIIEEVYNDDGEEKDVDEDEVAAVSLETRMERALLTTALLLSKRDVGAWALGSGWIDCAEDLPYMIDSGDSRAMCLASEVVSAAATLESAKGIIQSLITGGYMQTLITSPDRDIRSGAASAIAKVGLADKATSSDEAELMALLQGACDLLDDVDNSSKAKPDADKPGSSKLHHFSSFATSSIERGIEMMTYLVANTVVKEEVAAGFQVTGAPRTALERLVEISTLPNAGESLSGFGLATIFQHLAVTNLQLRKEQFEGKEVTMEQYDEMQKMGKTEEEKEMIELERDLDTQESCNERIRKLANAHVPRALVTLMEGASEHTLEQLVLAMNRMAGEPAVRGIMIQQGILTACIKVEKNEGPTETDTMCKVIRLARHCIAKLLVTTNPSLLTSAQRLGSVRPLIQLVRDIKASDLQHFEALLALTNIAGSGEDAKNKIVNEKGIAPLHFAMFSDHELVQRAATEAMCNLVPHQAMMEHLSSAENLKLWLAFASDYEQHYECARAAAGCLAMATQDESIALELISLEKFGMHMTSLVESGRLEVMHRALYIALNLVNHGGTCREKVVSEGLAAFCRVYVDKYHDNQGTEELEFSEEEQALLPVTIDVAKKIVSLTGDA